MSGSPVLIIGGTRESEATRWSLAFIARSMKRSTSLEGMSVEIISELALAMLWKLLSADCGLICWSIASMTHFCRAIRE